VVDVTRLAPSTETAIPMIHTLVTYSVATFCVAILLWLPLRGTAVGRFFGRVAVLAAMLFFSPAVVSTIAAPSNGSSSSPTVILFVAALSCIAFVIVLVRRKLSNPRTNVTRPRRRYQHRTNERLADFLERFTEGDDE
jgi:hypothetical protein